MKHRRSPVLAELYQYPLPLGERIISSLLWPSSDKPLEERLRWALEQLGIAYSDKEQVAELSFDSVEVLWKDVEVHKESGFSAPNQQRLEQLRLHLLTELWWAELAKCTGPGFGPKQK